MPARPACSRPAGPTRLLVAALALALLAGRTPARAAASDDAALLAAQKAAALRIARAQIWSGASAELRDARERAEVRQHRRHGKRSLPQGLHPRAAGGDDAPGFSEPVPAPLPGARAAAPLHALATTPPNVRCNDTSHDGTAATQSECHVGGIGDQVVVDWNNGQGFYLGTDVQDFGWSNDGGLSYTDGGGAPHPVGSSPLFQWRGDPTMATNERTGELWMCGLARPDGSTNAIVVAHGRFTAGAFAFDSTWIVRSVPNTDLFLDKEWIACDSTTGNLYVVNTTFGAADTIDLYRSTDGGRTWSPPLALSSALDDGWVQGARVAVAANGDVEAAWYAVDQVTVENDLRFRRSTDHGQTFLPEVTPVTFNEQFGTGAPGFNRDWGPNFPSLAVDRTSGPHRGRIYMAWAECWRFLATPVPVGAAAFEVEPNGAAASATPFTVGQTLRGTLTTSAYAVPDQDWWSFPLVAGQSVILFADSVQTDPLGHAWVLRLIAPDGTQRLCRGGVSDSTGNRTTGLGQQAYYTFTAPVSGTYYVDMVAASYRPTTYSVLTAFGTPGSERGRDQRDGFVAWSDDGAAWSAPVRLNDDGIGYDLYFPELAVGSDGAAYVTWFDHRDDTYGSRQVVYASRTTDGGATWAANAPLGSAFSNFTTSGSNIAPNMGDYNGIASTGTRLVAAWGDGRDPTSVDLWATSLDLTSGMVCPRDLTLAPGASLAPGWSLANHDGVFAGSYGVSLASARNWPLPAATSVGVPGGGNATWAPTLTVPDTAAAGTNTLCLTVTTPAGVQVGTCCIQVTVQAGATAVGADGARLLALASPRPNPASSSALLSFTLPRAGAVRLAIYDLAGARVRTLVEGERAAGTTTLRWDARDERGRAVHAGAYFERLEFEGRVLSRSVVIVR